MASRLQQKFVTISERSVAEEDLDAVSGCCTGGLCFEVGAVDDGVGGGLMGVANKQW